MKPDQIFDNMLQHERTALAWERTAIATIVAGALLARHAVSVHVGLAAVGIAQLISGAVLLVWAGYHYDTLHAPLRNGISPVHPTSARIVGITTIIFTGSATLIAILAAVL